jgi:hypothetical protein
MFVKHTRGVPRTFIITQLDFQKWMVSKPNTPGVEFSYYADAQNYCDYLNFMACVEVWLAKDPKEQ